MTTQVKDAPWIQETELYGMPPYEGDFRDEAWKQGNALEKADRLCDDIIELLLGAEDALMKYEETNDTAVSLNVEIRDMIHRVEYLGCDLRKLAGEVKRG